MPQSLGIRPRYPERRNNVLFLHLLFPSHPTHDGQEYWKVCFEVHATSEITESVAQVARGGSRRMKRRNLLTLYMV